ERRQVQVEVRDVRLRGEREARRRRHVADLFRSEGANHRRRGKDRRACQEGGELRGQPERASPDSLMSAPAIDPKNVDVVFLDAGGVLLYPDWERVSRILAKHGIRVLSAQLAEAEFVAKRRMDDAGFTTTTGDITEPDGYLGWVVKAADTDYDHEALHRAAAEFDEQHGRDNLWSNMPDEV